ncbi:hypothetical protein BDR07DRAFT_999263 [Suillus spraguei]|nr:hypothetical protein BDR07DRAFT_999263 [Suillus spraguei]
MRKKAHSHRISFIPCLVLYNCHLITLWTSLSNGTSVWSCYIAMFSVLGVRKPDSGAIPDMTKDKLEGGGGEGRGYGGMNRKGKKQVNDSGQVEWRELCHIKHARTLHPVSERKRKLANSIKNRFYRTIFNSYTSIQYFLRECATS